MGRLPALEGEQKNVGDLDTVFEFLDGVVQRRRRSAIRCHAAILRGIDVQEVAQGRIGMGHIVVERRLGHVRHRRNDSATAIDDATPAQGGALDEVGEGTGEEGFLGVEDHDRRELPDDGVRYRHRHALLRPGDAALVGEATAGC